MRTDLDSSRGGVLTLAGAFHPVLIGLHCHAHENIRAYKLSVDDSLEWMVCEKRKGRQVNSCLLGVRALVAGAISEYQDVFYMVFR